MEIRLIIVNLKASLCFCHWRWSSSKQLYFHFFATNHTNSHKHQSRMWCSPLSEGDRLLVFISSIIQWTDLLFLYIPAYFLAPIILCGTRLPTLKLISMGQKKSRGNWWALSLQLSVRSGTLSSNFECLRSKCVLLYKTSQRTKSEGALFNLWLPPSLLLSDLSATRTFH